MTCRDILEDASAFLDGQLPPERRASVERHLEACPECATEFDSLTQATGFVAARLREIEPSPALWRSIETAIAPPRRGRRLRGSWTCSPATPCGSPRPAPLWPWPSAGMYSSSSTASRGPLSKGTWRSTCRHATRAAGSCPDAPARAAQAGGVIRVQSRRIPSPKTIYLERSRTPFRLRDTDETRGKEAVHLTARRAGRARRRRAPRASAGATRAQTKPSPEDRKRRSIAESQHEIVLLHIERKEYRQAVDEAGKIFQMDWPADKEPTLLKSIMIYADRLIREKQEALALEMLDANFKVFRTNDSKIAILKEQGYLHRQLNRSSRALECFREAQRLEKQTAPHPD